MNDSRPPLLLRIYTGRENGLMVVGDRASLKALGQQLVTTAESEAVSSQQDWPATIASPKVAGPYSDTPDFTLSFHLEGQRPVGELLPLQRRGISPPFLIAVVIFSAVGLFTIARWVFANAL